MPKTHTVLCIDDDRTLCEILSRALRGEGYQVRTAHDGDQALKSIREGAPDLILLDLLLPKRDGFQVLEALRSEAGEVAETPVILISGCSQTPEYVRRASSLRVGAFLTKPVPLERLIAAVHKELHGAPRIERRVEGDRPTGGTETMLSGSLVEVPFPGLLHHLHGLRATGCLHLGAGKKRKGLQFRDGRPIAVKSNLVNECLGNLLVRMGRLDEAAMRESLRRVQQGQGLQGEILVAMEVLSESELVNALRVQASEKLFEIFEWVRGEFRFERDGRLEGTNTQALESSPANLILDGIRSRFPLARIDAFLRARADCYVVPGESAFYRYQEIDLQPAQLQFLSRLDERPRIAELFDESEESRRILYALLTTEWVQLGGSAPGDESQFGSNPRPRRISPPPPTGRNDESREEIRADLATMAERMRGANYFEVLGITEDAGDDDVRATYIDLAKRTHPDRFTGEGEAIRSLSEEIFKLVSQAHDTLSDGERRREYLRELRQGEREAADLEEGRRALLAEQQFQRGELALRRRDHAYAFECFDRAVHLYPEEGEYLAHLGWARYLVGSNDAEVVRQAVREIRRGAKLAPDREKPYLFLGRLLKTMQRPDAAERMFTRALQIRPDCVEALRELRLMNLRRSRQKSWIRRLLRR